MPSNNSWRADEWASESLILRGPGKERLTTLDRLGSIDIAMFPR